MWTDERVEQLKTLWTEGLSASQIARYLGEGVSRNAVIGKVHRIGLAGRADPQRPARPRLPSAPRLRIARPFVPPPPEPDAMQLEGGSFVGMMAVNDSMCRWPLGDPDSEEFHFCGHKPKTGSPYCEAHDHRAHIPTTRPTERSVARSSAFYTRGSVVNVRSSDIEPEIAA